MGIICKNLNEISQRSCYVEVREIRYKLHPTENFILRKLDEPKSLRTQYQVQNETKNRKSSKMIMMN